MQQMTAPPSSVQRLISAGLAVGAVTGLLVAVGSPLVLVTTGNIAQDSISLVATSLDQLDVAADRVDLAISTSSRTLAGVEAAVGDSSSELAEMARTGEELGQVLTEEVPAALEAVRAALPGLEDSARVLDRTMRALRLFGVDYDAEVPLDEAVAGIDAALAAVPETLRLQAERFAGTVSAMDSLANQTEGVARQVGEVGQAMDGLADSVDAARQSAQDARLLLERLNRLVGAVTGGGSILGALTGLGLMISQGGLWWWLRQAWAPPGRSG
jgi:hypothetical protein